MEDSNITIDDLCTQSKYDLISICNVDLSDDEVNDSPFVHNNNDCKYYEPIEMHYSGII